MHFYRDLLGFRGTFRTPKEGTPSHVELILNGFGVGLGTVEAARKVHGVMASPGSPEMSPVVQTPHDVGSSNRSALPRDPDGNLVEILAKRRR